MDILLAILSILFAMGMVADKDKDNRYNFTLGFAVCVVAIVILNIL